MMASTIATSAPATSSVPITSSEQRPGSAVSGTTQSTPASAITTIGTLTRNTLPTRTERGGGHRAWADDDSDTGHRRPRCDRLGRSRGGKTAFRIESVAGITNAAPRPMSTRSAIKTPAFGAKEAARLRGRKRRVHQ